MKKILNKKVSDKLANTVIVLCAGLVILLGFFYYQQTQRIDELELRLERNHQLQERVITTMKNENLLEEFLSLEGFTEEEKEIIKSFVEDMEEDENKDVEEEQ